MKYVKLPLMAIVLFFTFLRFCSEEQQKPEEKQAAHTNLNKFRQLSDEFATPNVYRTASGAPGPNYYQNMADYKIQVELDDKNQTITGSETITYKNNSPDVLTYLWLQLDQNIRKKDSPAKDKDGNGMDEVTPTQKFVSDYMKEPLMEALI